MSNDDELKIDPTKLGEHQGRLDELVTRVRTAHDAAGETIQSEAFGAFGIPVANDVLDSQIEGIETLSTALRCAYEHYQKVGIWKNDLGKNEVNIASLFATEVIENA